MKTKRELTEEIMFKTDGLSHQNMSFILGENESFAREEEELHDWTPKRGILQKFDPEKGKMRNLTYRELYELIFRIDRYSPEKERRFLMGE